MALNISSLPRTLRSVARAADTNGDTKLTRDELSAYTETQRAGYRRPSFIIGDLFPFLDKAARKNKAIDKNLAKADQLNERFDAIG